VVKIYDQASGADYYLSRALAAQGKSDEAASELQRATTLNGEMQQRTWYELSQVYRHIGKTAEAHAAVQKYEALNQAEDQAKSMGAEDWRTLDAPNVTDPAEKVQQ
jgi:predicted Zn-dependent protease